MTNLSKSEGLRASRFTPAYVLVSPIGLQSKIGFRGDVGSSVGVLDAGEQLLGFEVGHARQQPLT